MLHPEEICLDTLIPEEICIDTLHLVGKCPDTPRPEGRCRCVRCPEDICLDTLCPEEICLDTLRPVGKCPDTPRPEGRCRGTRRPGTDYLARLRPERLDVSDAYIAFGRSPCIRTQNFFPDADPFCLFLLFHQLMTQPRKQSSVFLQCYFGSIDSITYNPTLSDYTLYRISGKPLNTNIGQ